MGSGLAHLDLVGVVEVALGLPIADAVVGKVAFSASLSFGSRGGGGGGQGQQPEHQVSYGRSKEG